MVNMYGTDDGQRMRRLRCTHPSIDRSIHPSIHPSIDPSTMVDDGSRAVCVFRHSVERRGSIIYIVIIITHDGDDDDDRGDDDRGGDDAFKTIESGVGRCRRSRRL